MVEFHNVGEVSNNSIVRDTRKNEAFKEQITNVPMTSGKTDFAQKGTAVQKTGGNPFYEPTDFEHFEGLGSDRMTQADSATKRVKGELARLYNDVKRANPEAVEELEFPPLPTVPPKGKKALKLEAYLSALDQYRQICEDLLEGVGKDTVVDEVRAENAKTRAAVVAMGSANLAATLGVKADVINGLQAIYNKIDTSTKTVLSAVNANGQRVLRAIDKQTGDIKEIVIADGQLTRDQEYWNSVVADIREGARIYGVHRHIDDNGEWINRNTERVVDGAKKEITKKIDTSTDEIKRHTTKEHEETRDYFDPLGIYDIIEKLF